MQASHPMSAYMIIGVLGDNRSLRAARDCMKLCLEPSRDFAADMAGRLALCRLQPAPLSAHHCQHLSPWTHPTDPAQAWPAHDPQTTPRIRCRVPFQLTADGDSGGRVREGREEGVQWDGGRRGKKTWWKVTEGTSERNLPHQLLFHGDFPFSQNRNLVPREWRKLVVGKGTKKEKRKLLSHSSLSSFSPPPLADKISFQVLLSMNQADGPDDYLMLPKETLPACVKPLTSSVKVTLPALCSHTPGREHGFMAQSILLRVIHCTQGRAAEGTCSRRALG